MVKKFLSVFLAMHIFMITLFAGGDYSERDIERELIKAKQDIYNELYWFGSAESLRLVLYKDGIVTVEITWSGPLNKGISLIGLDFNQDPVHIYEISVKKIANDDSMQNAQTAGAWTAAATAMLLLLKTISGDDE